MRTKKEILSEHNKLWDKVWWNRHMSFGEPLVGQEPARGIEDRWGKDFLNPGDDIEWGICLGKMMALGWVQGMEWDESGDT